MKVIPNPFLSFMLAFALSVPVSPFSALAKTARQPIWAGRFYEADPFELKQNIDQLTRQAQKTRSQVPQNKFLRAIVMPHAGYIYSGWTAAPVPQVLPTVQFIVGHGDVRRLSKTINAIIDYTKLLVLSSDLFHFLSYSGAISKDRTNICEIINLEPDKLIKTNNRACGKMALLILTEISPAASLATDAPPLLKQR